MHAAVVDTHMGKERLSLRVDPETKDAINEYAEERDVSKSEAGRRMLRSGLSSSGYEIAVADGVGAVGEIEKLRNDLSDMEQRQVELAEKRERRIKRHWATALSVGVAFVIASMVGTYSPLLVIGGGMIILAAVVLTTYNAVTLLGDNDE
jgi:Flp pilus assembly protein TadB